MMRAAGYQRSGELSEAAWKLFRDQHPEESAEDALLLALMTYGLGPLIASPSVQRFFAEVQLEDPDLYRLALVALASGLPRPNSATSREIREAEGLYLRYLIYHHRLATRRGKVRARLIPKRVEAARKLLEKRDPKVPRFLRELAKHLAGKRSKLASLTTSEKGTVS